MDCAMAASCDIMIVGGGPAGLAFACSLAGAGLDVRIVEQAPLEAIAGPKDDGRAIALNHASMDILGRLGAAQRIPEHMKSPLRKAVVLDGPSPYSLVFDSKRRGADTLGWLVPNHAIRKALYETFEDCAAGGLMTGTRAEHVRPMADSIAVTTSDGSVVETRLLVAADTRFSSLRRQMGISAFMHDFGRTMIVCDMAHEADHEGTALECFFHGITVATLPLADRHSSIVLTVPSHEADRIMAEQPQVLAKDVERRLSGRLGRMTLFGERHAYPLVAVYAHAFHAGRFALIGDAAVGMHPVTAHGFNFGLHGQHLLAREILSALRLGLDMAAPDVLARYDRAHRLATFALFHATNGIASLYANDAPPARLLRQAGLRIANNIPFLKDAVVSRLTATAR